MPPDYNELPIPGSKKIENEDENKIKELVTGTKIIQILILEM